MVQKVTLRAPTEADTRAIAAVIAARLRPGDVVALTGELGAGKTTFVQGASAALGVRERVTSPTFLLRRDYEGRVPVIHVDVYRLDLLSEVLDLGYDEVLDGTHVTFIEWGDAMSPLLPADHLEIELRLDLDGDGRGLSADEPRRIVVRPYGDNWTRRIGAFAEELKRWRPHGEEP